MALDPSVIAMLQTLFAGGGYQGLPEYSATRGYLPFDSGTMGANINQLQDVAGLSGQGLAANPLVLAALGMTQGDQFGMVQEEVSPAVNDGATMLLQVINTTPLDSWENIVATGLYEGLTPDQASAAAIEAVGISAEETEAVDAVNKTASDWFNKLIQDRPAQMANKPGSGLQALRDLGIPDPGTQFRGVDVNSQLAPAADKYAKLRDKAAAADANVVMDTPVGSAGSSSAARHRQRANRKGAASGAPKITRIDPNASAADRKNRLDSIAARDTAGLDLRRQAGRADLMLNKLQELGVDPSRLAAQRILGQIQGLASGVYGY